MFIEESSGFVVSAAANRSSSVMPWPPPVVTLRMASVCCLMRGRNSMNRSGVGSGLPFSGSRACRWMIAAPASAAATASAAI